MKYSHTPLPVSTKYFSTSDPQPPVNRLLLYPDEQPGFVFAEYIVIDGKELTGIIAQPARGLASRSGRWWVFSYVYKL